MLFTWNKDCRSPFSYWIFFITGQYSCQSCLCNVLGRLWTFCSCTRISILAPILSLYMNYPARFLYWWLFLEDLLPWRCPLMMKASQEDAGCTQGCPRQAMLCYSWTMSRTQCWSLDACSCLKLLHINIVTLSNLSRKLEPNSLSRFHLPGS